MIVLKALAEPDTSAMWSFVYFHGDCEKYVQGKWWVRSKELWPEDPPDDHWCAPDLVSSDIELDEVPDGIHDVMAYDLPAKLYLWSYVSGRHPSREGWLHVRTGPEINGQTTLVIDDSTNFYEGFERDPQEEA